jgi:hypothetical protein
MIKRTKNGSLTSRTGSRISLCVVLAFSVLMHDMAGQVNSTPLVFMNASLISGTNGAVNAVYEFPDVTDGVDAQVKIVSKYNSAGFDEIDIPASNTGYDPAFQPYVQVASGTSGNPKTSYIEWEIRFKKANTTTDTTLAFISATAIDVDGTNNLQERVQAYTPSSYSVNSPNYLTVSTDGSSVTALGPNTNYNGIDSSFKAVMFQMNFENVNTITYRTGGVNRSSSASRQFSIYFKAFFDDVNPLPVELLHFTAEAGPKQTVNLNWATASETNNAYYTIEWSEDGENYEELNSVTGAGNTTQKSYYKYTDLSPLPGLNFYRLIQTDYDGSQRIYDPVTVTVQERKGSLSIDHVYPNPVNDETRVMLTTPQTENIELRLINSNGIEKKTIQIDRLKSDRTWHINDLQDLEAGVYYLQASQDGKVSKTIRLLKK